MSFWKTHILSKSRLINVELSILLLVYLYLFYHKEILFVNPSFKTLVSVVSGFVTVNLFVSLVNIASGFSNRLVHILNLIMVAVVNIFYAYHYETKTAVDYSVIADNALELFSYESVLVFLSSISNASWIITVLLVLSVHITLKRFQTDILPVKSPVRLCKFTFCLFLYISILILPHESYDDIGFFIKSIGYYYFGTNRIEITLEDEAYPFQTNTFDLSDKSDIYVAPATDTKPNVIVLLIESFSQNFVESVTEDGREVTPVINALIKNGVYVENFYGNSIQTCKGIFATLFSVVPSYRGKVFKDYKDVRFNSLPMILNNAGYETIFFQAYKNMNYDNTFNFLRKNGFRHLETAYDYLDEGEIDDIWGWGVEDKTLYNKFFQYLDERYNEPLEKPIFVTLSTIANHMRFNELPENRRFLFKKTSSMKENYQNSIHLSDKQLAYFISELRKRAYLQNTIVLISGDHGFPVEEHGIGHNEVGYYEEFFRTPLLILWDNLKPKRIKKAHSQVDIAPTIADLIGIRNVKNHFVGRSIFSNKENAVLLVQPYSGMYLGVVSRPYKYVFHKRTEREYLYNLDKDPRERENIIDHHLEIAADLKKHLKTIYLNQTLLERDRIWDSP